MEAKIYSALANIMGEVKAIEKSRKNQQQGFMYRGIDEVMNELHDIFARNRVVPLPCVKNYNVTKKVTSKGSLLYFTHATVDFTFIADDGSSVTITTVGEAMDSADKGMNKAMSIALKYALMQMLLIPTAEDKDPDGQTPPETRPETIKDIISRLNPDTQFSLITALSDVMAASTRAQLLDIYNNYPDLQNDTTFSKCLSMRKKEVPK